MKVFINAQLKMFTIVTLVDLHPIFNTFPLSLSSQLPPPHHTLHHAPSSPPSPPFTSKPSTCVLSTRLSTKVLIENSLTNAQSSWSPTGGQPATDQSSTGGDSRRRTDRSPCGTWTDRTRWYWRDKPHWRWFLSVSLGFLSKIGEHQTDSTLTTLTQTALPVERGRTYTRWYRLSSWTYTSWYRRDKPHWRWFLSILLPGCRWDFWAK